MLCDRMCTAEWSALRLCHLAVSQQFAKRILRWRRPPPAVLKLEKEREFERGERDLSASFLCFLFSPIARCPRIFLLTTSSRLQSEERTIKAKQRQKGGNDHGKEGRKNSEISVGCFFFGSLPTYFLFSADRSILFLIFERPGILAIINVYTILLSACGPVLLRRRRSRVGMNGMFPPVRRKKVASVQLE